MTTKEIELYQERNRIMDDRNKIEIEKMEREEKYRAEDKKIKNARFLSLLNMICSLCSYCTLFNFSSYCISGDIFNYTKEMYLKKLKENS